MILVEIDGSMSKLHNLAKIVSGQSVSEASSENLNANNSTAFHNLSAQKQSIVTPLKASAYAGSMSIGTSAMKVLIACMNSTSGNSVGLLDYFSDSIQNLRRSKTVINVFIHGLFAGYRMEMFYLRFVAWRTCTEKSKACKKKSIDAMKTSVHHAFSEWRVFATRQRDLSESASAIASEVSFVIHF
jgi:hypothetical protein